MGYRRSGQSTPACILFIPLPPVRLQFCLTFRGAFKRPVFVVLGVSFSDAAFVHKHHRAGRDARDNPAKVFFLLLNRAVTHVAEEPWCVLELNESVADGVETIGRVRVLVKPLLDFV